MKRANSETLCLSPMLDQVLDFGWSHFESNQRNPFSPTNTDTPTQINPKRRKIFTPSSSSIPRINWNESLFSTNHNNNNHMEHFSNNFGNGFLQNLDCTFTSDMDCAVFGTFSPPTNNEYFESFPREIFAIILSNLPRNSIACVFRVCRSWSKQTANEYLWKLLYERDVKPIGWSFHAWKDLYRNWCLANHLEMVLAAETNSIRVGSIVRFSVTIQNTCDKFTILDFNCAQEMGGLTLQLLYKPSTNPTQKEAVQYPLYVDPIVNQNTAAEMMEPYGSKTFYLEAQVVPVPLDTIPFCSGLGYFIYHPIFKSHFVIPIPNTMDMKHSLVLGFRSTGQSHWQMEARNWQGVCLSNNVHMTVQQ